MARSQRLFRQKYNESLDFLAVGGAVSNISVFASRLAISRTTARALMCQLAQNGLLDTASGTTARTIVAEDYFAQNQVLEPKEVLRTGFMQWVIQERLNTGTVIDEAQVATRLQIPMSAVREFLIGLSKFGFFRKMRCRLWIVDRMSPEFIAQLLDFRVMFELNSIAPLVSLPPDDPFWPALQNIRTQHLTLLETTGGETMPFVELDTRLHSLLSSASNNRIMEIFQEAVFFVFYYHYRWDNVDEKARNEQALKEHLRIIDGLTSGDDVGAKTALKDHLRAAKCTLINSIS